MSRLSLQPLERSIIETTVLDLFGFPGEPWVTAAGEALVLELLRAQGLKALADDALCELARLHEVADKSGRFRTDNQSARPFLPPAEPSRRIPDEGPP